MDKIPCACGCGIMIDRRDKYGRKRKFKLGHRDRVKYPNPVIIGDKHYNWKGGRRISKNGYIIRWQEGERRDKRRIPEHRLIMEKHLGRKLKSTEIVHHIDGNKHNNDIKNLSMTDRSKHCSDHLKDHWKNGVFTKESYERERDPKTGRFIQNINRYQ